MKSGGPWNLRGLHPEARAAARDAARRSGMSVGEWLNTVIQPVDEENEESWWSADFDREPEHREAPRPRRDRQPDYAPRQRFHDDDLGRDRNREVPRPRRDRVPDNPRPQSYREDDGRDRQRSANGRRRQREAEDQWPQSFHDDDREPIRQSDAPQRGRDPDDQFRLNFRNDDREPGRQPETVWQRRDRGGNEERLVRREGRPYREQRAPNGLYREESERAERPRREPERYAVASPAAEDPRDASIDKAVAEITARQHALDRDVAAEARDRPRTRNSDVAAEIMARQRALGDEPAAEPVLSGSPPSPQPQSQEVPLAWNESSQVRSSPEPALDLSNLEQQLRQITTRIEALRPSGDLETAINGLRTDLAEIGRSFTEALPRHALESLEIEIKALSQRIDHTRQAGVDSAALAGIEHGLAEVREALRGLTPAEGLVGFDEAVNALAKKVDAIVAKDDPGALQQLEAAIGALRGIVSHVASNDTLTKVAEDVRALSAKIDGIASSAASAPTLSALENRIDVLASALSAKVDNMASSAANVPTLSALENRIEVLASALNASAEAGHAVPRELEKLLSGLIEKLEWVQLSHTDHAALAHLEDRIATLVKRLDASDSRLGLLEGVERGLADLLVYIEQLRSTNGPAAGVKAPVAVDAMEHEVAEIKQTERRTRDSLEDMQGTVEHVVGRLAMIESDMRVDRTKVAPEEPSPLQAEATEPPTPEYSDEPAPISPASMASDPPLRLGQFEPMSHRLAAARTPIDPNLPPDHPLEPGSASGRSRTAPSAADRIAASEATAGSKPPVIPDPGGGKPDFIAAARRAARAAAAESPDYKASAKAGAGNPAQPKKLTERVRTVIVAAAVVVIVVGGYRIISRLFEDGSGAPSQAQTEPPRGQTTPQSQTEPPQAQPERPPARTEPPHVETEPLPAPATAMPDAKSSSLPIPVPGSLPGADSAQNPGALPPDSMSGANPGQQSLLDATTAPYAKASDPVSGDHKTRAHAAAAEQAVGAPIDITGSVPGASAPHSSTTTAIAGDKLPIAIGGPALRTAALAGDPLAAYEVAVRFVEGRGVPPNNEVAARWFEIAANKGIAPAQFRLGTLYEKGLGVKKDLSAARDLYRAAADKGHGKAMHNLAVLYAEGVDGKADYRTAAQWFRKAADHGVTDSQYNLAVLYARGVGVEQNFAESYKWFALAAKEGDQGAAQKRDEIASRLDPQALDVARLAVEKFTPVPQPADAVTVKGTWDPPANGTPAAKPKPRSAKASAPDVTKVN